MKLLFRYKSISLIFIVLSAIYLASNIFMTPDKATLAKYNISAAQAMFVTLSIALPYVVIWFIALFGYLGFRSYSSAIKNSRDGEAFSVISKGLLLLSVWLPVSATLEILATNYYRSNPDLTPTFIIMLNYLNLVILFPAFYILSKGAGKLLSIVKPTLNAVSQKTALLYIGFSALYVMLTLEDTARYAPTGSTKVASYYLPDWLIITTIVIPRLIMWFWGIKAIEDIYLYRKRVKGKLYKAALQNVAQGIIAVVLATIMLRCIQSLTSPLSELSLVLIILLLYVFLVALGIGYVLIFRGARKLQKIEEL